MRWLKLILKITAALLTVLLLAAYFGFIYPFWGMPFNAQRRGNVPLTPAWALEPWVWQDDHHNAAFTLELLDGYRDHDFPVGTILIDAPWSMRLNDFVMDEERYPNPGEFIRGLKARGLRVALWMTPSVNSHNKGTAIVDSSDWFAEAARKGYLVGGDYQKRWWRGRGGLVDYTNPEAMAWWRGMQHEVLSWGIDAWKLDDSATYFGKLLFGKVPIPYQRTHAGWMTTRQYMDLFYREEYKHGLTYNPQFVTMGRSIDSPLPMIHPEGFSPQDASTLNWVGDNRHTWTDAERGLERAIRCILRSAKLGYNLPGSDIGGYHGGMPIPPELYIRWTQFSTFCGFFLNGGHGERRIWKRSDLELHLIRRYSWLRSELVPYIYSHVVRAHQGGPVLMRLEEGKYHYLFGDDFLVAPIYEDNHSRTVTLPPGRWRYWFDDLKVIDGGTPFTRDYPIHEYPVYVRDGAIIPMNISRAYTGIGDEDWASLLTLNIYPNGISTFTVHHTDGSGKLDVETAADKSIQISLKGDAKPLILRVLAPSEPTRVVRNDVELQQDQWTYQGDTQRVVIKSESPLTGVYVIHFE